ncbi:Rhodanese-like domain protein [Streptococcus sp. DD10]|uniref:rhodanese-like domain-containing protein n=1 Tax=Streptococcus sp. DD10 TaxID=1777878 RepID=UPI00079698AD|nr:rhodanese-like domain-containing protein [Streptococcus sp. DD10]KXT73758.1 Rhodanese-like domain protein [Streptococcus sp. DD10]
MWGTILLWTILLAVVGWMGYNYWRIRKAAKIVDNETFAGLIRSGQLVDLRTPEEFRRKHILGARNIQGAQLKDSLAALRKDKPVLIYENSRSQLVSNAALLLRKNGYKEIYILDFGINEWNGKAKTAK